MPEKNLKNIGAKKMNEKNLYYDKILNEFIKLNLYELLEIEINLNIFDIKLNKEIEYIFNYKNLNELKENDLKYLSNEFKNYFNEKLETILNYDLKKKIEIINYINYENNIMFKFKLENEKILFINEIKRYKILRNNKKYLIENDYNIIKIMNENELNNNLIETLFKDIKNYELYYNYEIEY